jgi:hypothetical protein
MRNLSRVILPALLVAAALAPARATTMRSLEIDDLTDQADAVVLGRVVGARSRWTADRRAIVTEVRLRVVSSYKGRVPAELTILRLGGVVDGLGMRVLGEASFVVGERALVFLRSEGAAFRVVGMAQGKLRVLGDGAAARVEADLAGLETLGPGGRPRPRVTPGPRPLADVLAAVRARAGGRR